MAERGRWSWADRLKNIPRLLVVMIKDFFKWISPTFFCFVLVVQFFEAYVYETWRGLEAIISHILVNMGSKYVIYTAIFPADVPQLIVPPRHHRITLTFSTFAAVLAADLPYILRYVDLELRPSLFTVRGLLSFIICFLTVADILIFMCRLRRALQMELYSQLYWQSCLRFLVFVGLIVIGGANMIDKAWHGALVFHKHVMIPLSFCVFGYIRLCEKYCRLRRMMKKAMIVVPIDEVIND